MRTIDKNVYSSGIRFECTGCGECCKARGNYAYVYVTLAERRRLAVHLGIPTRRFTMEYCEKTDGKFHLRDPSNDCLFLDGARCTVYRARPQQCRTWPFWPENMTGKVWDQQVRRDCPGVGLGRLYSPREVESKLAEETRRAGQR